MNEQKKSKWFVDAVFKEGFEYVPGGKTQWQNRTYASGPFASREAAEQFAVGLTNTRSKSLRQVTIREKAE